jgi:hypothetical protein
MSFSGRMSHLPIAPTAYKPYLKTPYASLTEINFGLISEVHGIVLVRCGVSNLTLALNGLRMSHWVNFHRPAGFKRPYVDFMDRAGGLTTETGQLQTFAFGSQSLA